MSASKLSVVVVVLSGMMPASCGMAVGDEFTVESESPAGKSGSTSKDAKSSCSSPCPDSTPQCNPNDGSCVECLVDDHCAGEKTNCHPTELRCVECLNDGDCEDGDVCDLGSFKCEH